MLYTGSVTEMPSCTLCWIPAQLRKCQLVPYAGYWLSYGNANLYLILDTGSVTKMPTCTLCWTPAQSRKCQLVPYTGYRLSYENANLILCWIQAQLMKCQLYLMLDTGSVTEMQTLPNAGYWHSNGNANLYLMLDTSSVMGQERVFVKNIRFSAAPVPLYVGMQIGADNR